MVYLLTYDGYMREGYLEEICPSAILFMQCGLKDCALEFRRFYETAMPTLEVGDEIVPAVIWKLEESDLQNMEAIYPNEIHHIQNTFFCFQVPVCLLIDFIGINCFHVL